MQPPIVFEHYQSTAGFVAVGEKEAALVASMCFDDREPFMGTNARHKKFVPMIWVSDAELPRVIRILNSHGHYITFKSEKQRAST
jgi:hypothetical protein